MTVIGASKAIVCALFDKDWTMHYFEIPLDIRFSFDLIQKTHHFYKYNLQMGVPPRITPSLDKEDVLEKLTNPPKTYTPSEIMTEKCTAYAMLKEQIKELDKEADALHDDILAMYHEGNIPATGFRVSASKRTSTKIDQKKLEEEFPDAYEACKTVSEYAVHTIRKK
jgi:predicted phage-related endonuclease